MDKDIPLNDVVLWFEFLLSPNLLLQHLKKPKPDPSAVDLIQQFIAVAPDLSQNQQQPSITIPPTPDIPPTPTIEIPEIKPETENVKLGRKSIALKILALKVAAYLNFNLDILEKHLPLEKQLQLLSDLCTIITGKLQTLPVSPIAEMSAESEAAKAGLHFALTLFYRFVIRSQVKKGCQIRMNKFMIIPGTDPNALQNREDFLMSLVMGHTQAAIEFLEQILHGDEDQKIPLRQLTFDCFVALDASSESTTQKFELAIPISENEVKAQIHYDLCTFYIFTKNYKLARENIIQCQNTYKMLNTHSDVSHKFCSINEEELHAYLMACGVFDPTQTLSLMHKMNKCILANYVGIVEVFKEDNLKREIPIIQRKIVELDIEGSISTAKMTEEDAKEMYHEVIVLNVLRYILDDSDILSHDLFIQRYKDNDHVLKIFLRLAVESYGTFDLKGRNLLKQYMLNLVEQLTDAQLAELIKPSIVFSQPEIDDFKRQRTKNKIELSGIGISQDLSVTEGIKVMPRLEQAAVERQLINCMNPNQIRKILVKLAGMNPTKPVWAINPAWILPDSVRAAIMNLNRGFLQDFSYTLCGKAKEMVTRQEYLTAISLLNVIRTETNRQDFQTNPNVMKLGRIIHWEIILVQIQQTLCEWIKRPADVQALSRNCKSCMMALNNNETVIPRMEILEYSLAMLLNLGEYSNVISVEKRGMAMLDLYSVFASAVLDIEKSKTIKNKMSKEAWDLVLPMFLNTNQQNNQRRPGARDSRDSPSLPQSSNLYAFFKKLRDPLIISIVLSLLCRIHNVLKDEQNLDINAEYMFLWPSTLPNPNGYNLKAVAEAINILLKHAFNYYPNYVPWLKIKGDLEFCNGNYEPAMKFYVTSLIASTEYCMQPLQKPSDDFVIRRMIKCSTNLGCYMQAAVLCQFFDETDYAMAFKSISEKSSNSSDAMDAYYGCIWDPTLLEFIINMHSKKGEHKRKLQAISFMGLLELNANNNDEIKVQAASARKIKFLRALAKQYMF